MAIDGHKDGKKKDGKELARYILILLYAFSH
jgi:hypothetical protein